MIARQPRVAETGADSAALHYDFVQRSLVFRFPDAIRSLLLGKTELCDEPVIGFSLFNGV